MPKIGEESKSSPKSLYIRNIIIVLTSIILTLSLATNFLVLSKLSKIQGNLNSQDSRPVWGESDSPISGQEQELFLQMNPALNKIKHIQQQIISREVIKDDELIGVSIDSKIIEDIKAYNELVPKLKGFFADQAVRLLRAFLEQKSADDKLYAPDFLEIPSDIREYVEIITDLSLYRNCTELLRSDSRLAFIIYSEAGGSGGMWPYFWHTEYLRDNGDIQEGLDRLYELVEKIITALDKEYENLLIND